MFGEKPLEHFYPQLANSQLVRRFIEKTFKEESAKILLMMQKGEPLPAEFVDVHDIIGELAIDTEDIVKRFYAMGSAAGEYPIDVMNFEGVYSVSAPEFDDIGYFATVDEAETALLFNWNAYERPGDD